MRFGVIDKVILFGGAPLLVATAKHLRVLGMQVSIYTSPRHATEPLEATGVTLAQALQRLDMPFVCTDDINRESGLLSEITESTLGIGMGEAWSFSREVIAHFGGHLLDFMGIPHPRYRGGAHYTWMILHQNLQGGCNLQVINEKMIQGEYDSGAIVKSRSYAFPEWVKIPQDYFDAAVPEEVNFIQEFLDEVRAGRDFPLQEPDESRSLFLPRLNTMTQGWIDWTWTGKEIERFICAFDSPYAGASTHILGVRVHLKSAILDKDEQPFHPFQSGLITRSTAEEGLVIATRSGHLKVKSISPASGETLVRSPSVGDRFVTPASKLETALTYRASYGSKI